jgi:hypothetical protein
MSEVQEKIKKVEEKLGVELLGDKPILKLDNEGKYRFINEKDEKVLDEKIISIREFIKSNNGKGLSEEEKDRLYGQAQDLYKELVSVLSDTEFNLFLTRDQYTYLTDLLIKRMDYTVDTIFFAIDLNNTLIQMKELANFNDDKGLGSFPFTATDITYTYHLLKDHTVKGIQKSTYVFSEILRRIADISKIFKYYDNEIKNCHKEIVDWVACFDDNVSKEEKSK